MKKFKTWLTQHLKYIWYKPFAWISHCSTDYETDRVINKIISEGKLVKQSSYEHTLAFDINGSVVRIWCSNWPYAYGSIRSVDNIDCDPPYKWGTKLPYMGTRLKLKAVQEEALGLNLAKNKLNDLMRNL